MGLREWVDLGGGATASFALQHLPLEQRTATLRAVVDDVVRDLRRRYPEGEGYVHASTSARPSPAQAFRAGHSVRRGLTWGLGVTIRSQSLSDMTFSTLVASRLENAALWSGLTTVLALTGLASWWLGLLTSMGALLVTVIIGLVAAVILWLVVYLPLSRVLVPGRALALAAGRTVHSELVGHVRQRVAAGGST